MPSGSSAASAAVQRVREALGAACASWPPQDAHLSDAAHLCHAIANLVQWMTTGAARGRALSLLETTARQSGASGALWHAASVAPSARRALAEEAWRTRDDTLTPRDLFGLAAALPELQAQAVAEAVRRAAHDPLRTWSELRAIPPDLATDALAPARSLPEPTRGLALDAILPALQEPHRSAVADERAGEALAELLGGSRAASAWTTLAAAAATASAEAIRRVIDALLRLDAPESAPALQRCAARLRALGFEHDPRLAGNASLAAPAHPPGTHLGRVTAGKEPARLRYVQDHAAALLAAHGAGAVLEAIHTLSPRFRCPALVRVLPLLAEPDARGAARDATELLASLDSAPEALVFELARSGNRLDATTALPVLSRCTEHLRGAADASELLASREGRSIPALAPLLSVWGDDALLGTIDALLEIVWPRARAARGEWTAP